MKEGWWLTMWLQDGTGLQNFYWVTRNTVQRSICGPLVVSWVSSVMASRCSRVILRWTNFILFRKYSDHWQKTSKRYSKRIQGSMVWSFQISASLKPLRRGTWVACRRRRSVWWVGFWKWIQQREWPVSRHSSTSGLMILGIQRRMLCYWAWWQECSAQSTQASLELLAMARSSWWTNNSSKVRSFTRTAKSQMALLHIPRRRFRDFRNSRPKVLHLVALKCTWPMAMDSILPIRNLLKILTIRAWVIKYRAQIVNSWTKTCSMVSWAMTIKFTHLTAMVDTELLSKICRQ